MNSKHIRVRICHVVLGAICWGVSCVELPVYAAPPRAALLATTMNADSEKYLDVAVAELTTRGGVELVERREIRQVLGEQALALQQDDSGVAAGKLLRADVVGVLETTSDGKEAGGFAVLDTATGVSYWNQGIDQTGVAAVVGEVVKGLTTALEKRSRAGTLSTVCVLGARNAEFPRSLDVFCETVAYLLDRQLVANPSVTTLDRRRLETVVSENNLPGVESKNSELLPSLRLVELDFRQGPATNEVRVLARVTDAKSNVIAQPEVTGPRDAAALAEQLQAALADVLHTAPLAAGNREEEAKRFRAQGKTLWNRDRHEEGLRLYAVAYALNPGSPRQVNEYVDRLFHRAYDLSLQGEFGAALDYVNQAFDAEDQHDLPHVFMPENSEDFTLATLARCKSGIPAESPAGVESDRTCRRYLSETGITADPPGRLTLPVHAGLVLSRNAGEFFRLMNLRLEPWLARERDPAQRHDSGILRSLSELCGGSLRNVWVSRGYIPFDAEYVRGLRDVAARFESHSREVIRLEGGYFALMIDLEAEVRGMDKMPPEEVDSRVKDLVDEAVKTAGNAENLPDGDLATVYELAMRGACLVDDVAVHCAQGVAEGIGLSREMGRKIREKELSRIALAMFANRHMSGAVLHALLTSSADFEKYRRPVLQRLDTVRDARNILRLHIQQQEIEDFLKMLPSGSSAAPLAACPARRLWALEDSKSPGYRVFGLSVQGDPAVYAFTGRIPAYWRNDGAPLDLLRLDVEAGYSKSLGRFHPRTCWKEQHLNETPTWGCEGPYVADVARSDRYLWIASSGDGIFGVPLAPGGGEPLRIGMADGLPSDVIHSVAAVGDVLYVGCGAPRTEGYVVCFDLKTEKCTVLASNLRADPETPLDSLAGGFQVCKLLVDMPRNRLLLVLDHGDFNPATGLWEYRFDRKEFRQILRLDRPAHSVEMGDDAKLWIRSICRDNRHPVNEMGGWYGIVELDLVTGAARLVAVSKNKGAGPNLPVREDTLIQPDLLPGGALVAEGWLNYFAEIIVDGERLMEVRRVSLATREVRVLDAGKFRGNIYQWGWLRWLPGPRIMLAGDGNQIVAVHVAPQDPS